MENEELFIETAKLEVCKSHNDKVDTLKGENNFLSQEDIFVVWSCKTLQNRKAILGSKLLKGIIYEVTYNGDKKEIYVDAYKKFENKCIKLEEE